MPTCCVSGSTVPRGNDRSHHAYVRVGAPAINPLLTPAPAPPPATGPTCTAGQLQGVLPAWVSGEASDDGGMDPTGPRPVVPAHGAVRFAMQLAIPALACPTERLTISWPPSFDTGGPHASFGVAVRG
jgi:hypothetical protein